MDQLSELDKIYYFSTFIERLKKIERFKGQYYWKDYPKRKRYESVADHSWRLSVLLILFQDKLSKKLNLEKALKMALIHDLPEIFAGDASPMGKTGTGIDTHAFNPHRAQKRHNDELLAAKDLFEKLPSKENKEMFKLWQEYEKQTSFEAKVVKSLDKIECMLQVLEYRKGHMFSEHLDFTIKYGMKGSSIDPAIRKYGEKIVSELKKKYKKFYKPLSKN